MLDFNGRTRYYLCDKPTDMRKGRNGLAGIVREILNRDPLRYDEAFIFYGRHYDIVKILHYDLNGYVMYEKWFDEGRFLKPVFMEARRCHWISLEQLILLLATAVQTKLCI
jgi:transposase